MQATITYLLTEQAQRAQMVATGQPVARKQTVTVEVSAEDLALCQVDSDGNAYLDLATKGTSKSAPHSEAWKALGFGGDPEFTSFAPDFFALIRDASAAIEAKRQAERNKIDAAMRDFLASDDPVTDRYYTNHVPGLYTDISGYTDELTVSYRTEAARRFAIHEAKVAADKAISRAEQERAETEKSAADAARESAKAAFIAEWIAEHADDETRAQFADNLLCRNAAVSLIADSAFSAAGVPDRFTRAKFCQDSDCPCGESILDCLPRSKYPAWKAIKSGLREGYSVEFSRYRECLRNEDEGRYDTYATAGPVKYLAEIKLPHGPFVFERTIEL